MHIYLYTLCIFAYLCKSAYFMHAAKNICIKILYLLIIMRENIKKVKIIKK